MINKEQLIESKRKKMFNGFALSSLLISVIEVILYDAIKGTNFRNPKMFAKLDKSHKLLTDIQKSELSQVVTIKDDYVDIMENDHAVEVLRLLNNMAFYPTDHLKEFNDGVELQNKERGKNY